MVALKDVFTHRFQQIHERINRYTSKDEIVMMGRFSYFFFFSSVQSVVALTLQNYSNGFGDVKKKTSISRCNKIFDLCLIFYVSIPMNPRNNMKTTTFYSYFMHFLLILWLLLHF
jgi:hypothetical protein